MQQKLRSILLALFALVIGTAFSLLLVEVLVRVLNLNRQQLADWQDRPAQYYYHEASNDLRDLTHFPKKAEGTIRVAVIGDSFSFAPYLQADDTFAKRLERLWNLNKNQPKVEVINYGVPGYSTAHEIAPARQALAEGADLIILQVTLNDPEIKPYIPTGLLQEQSPSTQPPLAPSSWLARNWKTFKFVQTRLHNFNSAQEYKNYYFGLWNTHSTWWHFMGAAKEIARFSRANKTPMVAVVFPLFGFPNDDSYPFAEIHQKVAKIMHNIKVDSLDLLPAYKNIPLDRMVVLPGRDRHPNEIAHRIAAEQIYAWLKTKDYLPSEIFAKTTSANRIGIIPAQNQEPFNLKTVTN